MYDECTELLLELVEARGADGPLLTSAQRDRALLCLALIDEAREESAAHAKFATLGRLAAAVLHELLNPLAFVQTNLEVLSGHLPGVLAGEAARDKELSDETKSLVEDSRRGVERISTALSALRILLRDDTGVEQRGDVRRAAEAAARLVHVRLNHRVHLVTDLAEVPRAATGEGLVGQVLLQLLLGALESLPDSGGTVALRCRATPEAVVREVEHTSGQPTDLDQLGFSLAQHLVERAGGRLDRMELPSGGALYAVQLPLAR